MIAIAGALRLTDATQPDNIVARARWSLETLATPGAA